ncbi:peptidylprolyl isomerase [Tepidibacillus sp. LV47]|uniref:peptidylprolyl isomerase n=1 Tax=Tepidibacillus sp. LV47 TaxID=3398228 RepID=UPI003AB00F5F
MSKRKKRFLLFFFIIALTLTTFGCNNDQENNKVVAEFKDGQVLQRDFDKYLNVLQFLNPQVVKEIKDQNVKRRLLEQFIAERYLGTKEKLSPQNEQDVDNAFQYLKEQKIQMVGSEDNYQKELKNLKITENDIKDYLKRNIGIQIYFENQITKDQLKHAFQKSKQDFVIATVSHILIGTNNRTDEEARKRANEVLAKLKAGQDFTKLAKEYSDDPGSKDKGGIYENVSVINWVPEFKEAVLKQPTGKISDQPVKTQYGYHIIKVISRKVPSFEQLKENEISILKRQLIEEMFSNFMNKDLPKLITKIDLSGNNHSK